MKLKKSVKDIQQSGTSKSSLISSHRHRHHQVLSSPHQYVSIVRSQQSKILELLLIPSLTSTGQVFGFSVAAFSAFLPFKEFPELISERRNRCVTCAHSLFVIIIYQLCSILHIFYKLTYHPAFCFCLETYVSHLFFIHHVTLLTVIIFVIGSSFLPT